MQDKTNDKVDQQVDERNLKGKLFCVDQQET